MREQLLCYALRYEGDWKKMKLALDRQEPWTRMAYEGSYVTIADQAYPCLLYTSNDFFFTAVKKWLKKYLQISQICDIIYKPLWHAVPLNSMIQEPLRYDE